MAPVAANADCLPAIEADLVQMINQYRAQNGLAAVSASASLATVARWHIWDLNTNHPDVGQCNTHSWSHARPDLWSAVCYTPDHAQAAGMWAKPREITGVYPSEGFEIAFGCSGCAATAQAAFDAWRRSAAHNDVLLNQGVWARLPWRAMGVSLGQGYAVAWFGASRDPAGELSECQTQPDAIFQSDFEN
ncbi:MAG: CAP domain-containing protein [Gammaproteobacteria bacterium]